MHDVTIEEPPAKVKIDEYPDYLAGEEDEEPPLYTEYIPQPQVVDFVEPPTPTYEAREPPTFKSRPGEFTTMGAMKLAQSTQMSPYEPRTDIFSKLRDRQSRDTVKEINQQFFVPLSPRRRVNTTFQGNLRRKSPKSKPGAHYESPYAARALVA